MPAAGEPLGEGPGQGRARAGDEDVPRHRSSSEAEAARLGRGEPASRVEAALRRAELGEARVHRREGGGVGEGVLGEVEAPAELSGRSRRAVLRERAQALSDVRDVERERDARAREGEEAAPFGARRLQDGEERGGTLARDLLEEAAAPLGGRLAREEGLVLDEAAPAVETVPGADGVEREEEAAGSPRRPSRRVPRRSRGR